MSYPVRQDVEGSSYHVDGREQRVDPLFFSSDDHIAYREHPEDELDRRGEAIGSFCLMTNRTHFPLRMGETSPRDILRNAHFKFAKQFSQKRHRDGHVTRKRPGTVVVLNDVYRYTLVGSVHDNSLTGEMVRGNS